MSDFVRWRSTFPLKKSTVLCATRSRQGPIRTRELSMYYRPNAVKFLGKAKMSRSLESGGMDRAIRQGSLFSLISIFLSRSSSPSRPLLKEKQAYQRWKPLVDVVRRWQVLVGVGRHWQTLVDFGRHRQTLVDIGRHWQTLVDI